MPFSVSNEVKKATYYRRNGETLYEEHPKTDGGQVALSATYSGGSATTAQAEFEALRTLIATMQSTIDGQTKMTVVADITARDALTGMNVGDQVWVIDASADNTVSSGAAKYVYQDSTNGWVKTAEAESMDVVVDWSDVQNKEVDVIHVASVPATMPSGLADGGLVIVDTTAA
ncbi:MAG: hypothetical protein J5861_04475 [Desulfovibrio sp.]|nr:hypothetical protein [Desulfovibrio sp.]